MTKEILISGDLRQICFDTPSRNLNMVEVLNEVLRMNVYPTLYFDVIPFREDDDLSALLAFYMEKSPMYFDNRFIWSNLADIITGESKNIELPSPFIKNTPNDRLLEIGFFGRMWSKNSDALGGDHFSLSNIKYTANGMYLLVRFE